MEHLDLVAIRRLLRADYQKPVKSWPELLTKLPRDGSHRSARPISRSHMKHAIISTQLCVRMLLHSETMCLDQRFLVKEEAWHWLSWENSVSWLWSDAGWKSTKKRYKMSFSNALNNYAEMTLSNLWNKQASKTLLKIWALLCHEMS